MKTGVELIADERCRQVEEEGFDANHDRPHAMGQLALAGGLYALDAKSNICEDPPNLNEAPAFWPWDDEWWKPTPYDLRRQLVKSGALIAAEIDRLQEDSR